ncbi:hypothetical protein B0H13DRAFT_1904012 [Mycena leptocephala]|nr:hypothetical protein B0H13DRAFT_1904012 [Mycena leptocephala]
MSDEPPITPKKKGPAFKPRTPRTLQAPIQKYDPNAPMRPYPVGDYLIVRGIIPTDPPIAPLRQLNRAINKITDANHDSFEDVMFVVTDGPYSSSAYVQLHADHNPTDEDPEPHVDWLEALAEGIHAESHHWDIAWAPAHEKDKCTWVRVLDIFKDLSMPATPIAKKSRREEDLKVIAILRKLFDDAGHTTVDGFRVSDGDAAIIIFAHPSYADVATNNRSIKFAGVSHTISPVHQIEIECPFEIAVGGFSKFAESCARDACDSWFNAFERNSVSLLAETRTDPHEKDYVFYTMANWTTTHHVLSTSPVTESFLHLTAKFGLHQPQLIYNMNTNALWRKDVATVISQGAEKIDSAIVALTHHLEAAERQNQAHHDASEARMGRIETTLDKAVTSLDKVVGRIEDIGRRLHIQQQDTYLLIELARIDAYIKLARNTIDRPVDDADRNRAVAQYNDAQTHRNDIRARLDALHNSSNGRITGPELFSAHMPLLPSRPSPSTLSASSNKRARTSTNGPATMFSAPDLSVAIMDVDDDGFEIVPHKVRSLESPPLNCLMVARVRAQSEPVMNKPRLMHSYICGPDGMHGFTRRRILRGPLDVDTSRHLFVPDSHHPVVNAPTPNMSIFLFALIIVSCLIQVAVALSLPFSVYALNANGLMDSVELHHINTTINARSLHAFVLSESKTNSKIGPNLPNDDYNLFEELGVQSDNFHTYKWGAVLGIQKNIQIAQRVAVTAASLHGRVIAVDLVLSTSSGKGFIHRMVGTYALWDPGQQDTRLLA